MNDKLCNKSCYVRNYVLYESDGVICNRCDCSKAKQLYKAHYAAQEAQNKYTKSFEFSNLDDFMTFPE